MVTDRFKAVSTLTANGTIAILSRDIRGLTVIRIPKFLWLQLTKKDVIEAASGTPFNGNVDRVQMCTDDIRGDDVVISVVL